jgi:hypothetical protein
MNNEVEILLSLWKEIKAIEHYLRHLKDKYAIIEEHILGNGTTIPKEIGDCNIKVKTVSSAYLPEREDIRNRILDYLQEKEPEAVKRNVHPLTLIKLIDMGLDIPEKEHIRIETRKIIKIDYKDEAIGAVNDEEILKRKGLI